MKKLKSMLAMACIGLVFVLIHFPNRFFSTPEKLQKDEMLAVVKDILKLGVIEIHISQIFEFSKDNIRIASIPIPFTNQHSLLVATGTILVGYDLEQAEIVSQQEKGDIFISLSHPLVLSTNVDFRFIQEEDTFLRRITSQDRNQIMSKLKISIQNTVLTPDVIKQSRTRVEQLLFHLSKLIGRTINSTYQIQQKGAVE